MGSPEGTGHLTTDELFRQYAGFVARFLTRLGVPSDQLDDAMQEVFLVAHRNGGYRPGLAKPTSYLGNLAIRAAAQHRRRSGAARMRHSEAPLDHMPDQGEDPVQALQVRQDLQRLQQALARLPEELCTTLILVELEGESCVSVAAGLGCPVGTIYWRLHQARKQLQFALKAVDSPHRSPRAAHAPGERLQPSRSFMGMFGIDAFHRSEASRLLQLAREQPSPSLAIEQLLAQHQQLVQSGGQLPAWASGFAPHAPTWVSLLGAGPITAGITAGGAILATVLLTTYATPSAEQEEQPAPHATAVVPEVTPPIATAAPAAPSQEPALEAPRPSPIETPRGKATRERQPRSAQRHRTQDAPTAVATSASTGAATSPAAAPALESPDPAAPPAPEPKPQAARQQSSAAPDLELAEMREIERAQRLLSDDPGRALALTRSMQAGFPEGRFREERAYIEVMALLELGRTREVREKAATFLRAYPAGLYSNRVRKAAAQVE